MLCWCESGDAYQELKSVLIRAEAEIVDELEYTAETMSRVSIFRGDARADQQDSVKQGAMGGQAAKRGRASFQPVSVVSWDHTKLGGVY